MYFFDDSDVPLIPTAVVETSARTFIEGAVKALKSARGLQRDIILRDLAEYVGCDYIALNFMVETPLNGGCVDENHIIMPDVRDF